MTIEVNEQTQSPETTPEPQQAPATQSAENPAEPQQANPSRRAADRAEPQQAPAPESAESAPAAPPEAPIYGATGLIRAPEPMGPAKNEMNPTLFIAALGAGFGLLVGVVFATISWRGSNAPAANDMKIVDASAYGLKGHLVTKWDDRLGYRLTIEPDDPARRDGFSHAVLSSPRPLSIDVQLHDQGGFVLCTKTILLKYDPKGAGTSSGTEVARAEAAELQREQGKDVFQNAMGGDGKVDSISAQGQLGCSAKEYANTASWGLLPDFPSAAEQAAIVKPAAPAETREPQESAHRRVNRKPTDVASPYYIEGNDAIVAYDPSSGALQLGFGKFFFLDKTGPEAKIVEEQDLPVKVYYKCDQAGICTLARNGAFLLHVRTRP
jgi:hypothetical protein